MGRDAARSPEIPRGPAPVEAGGEEKPRRGDVGQTSDQCDEPHTHQKVPADEDATMQTSPETPRAVDVPVENNDILIGEKFKMNGKKFIGIKLFDD